MFGLIVKKELREILGTPRFAATLTAKDRKHRPGRKSGATLPPY